ncbi:hypothetical protein [Leptospira ilyithenensis]|uniref:Uncharacterized protein n=1 Tax=Leptospira ilyithenensis TaxID=2484901 RepID=A0A4R9LMH7_9LEPT|nr:hypothetical protein [Leptospira ilyithenensis]TGN09762.1 hypothetical protein EHS11_11815 [Leptospira ilyithenensis]
MALDFGFCLSSTPYTGRKCRFAVEYTSWNESIQVSPELLRFYSFSKNDKSRRVSFVLPEGSVKRCEFTTKLITDHPSAESFLTEFKRSNPRVLDEYIRFYVFDDKGTDIPFVPNVSDITSATGLDEVKKASSGFVVLLIVGGLGYFGFKQFKKPQRKKK